jgi:hypothetical protein
MVMPYTHAPQQAAAAMMRTTVTADMLDTSF